VDVDTLAGGVASAGAVAVEAVAVEAVVDGEVLVAEGVGTEVGATATVDAAVDGTACVGVVAVVG
jgi:hypothetical protein